MGAKNDFSSVLLRDSMAVTVLITREGPDALREQATWEARGLQTALVPCLEVQLLPWPWAPVSPQVETLTIFTSRRAVAAWQAAGRPPGGGVAALAPATAETLAGVGVVPLMAAEGGVVKLAEALERWWQARGHPGPLHLRYPTSQVGLQSEEQAAAVRCLSGFAEVDRRLAYSVRAPAQLKANVEQAKQVAQGDWALSFSSPSGVTHFLEAQAELVGAPRWVVCHGMSTQRVWNSTRPPAWPKSRSCVTKA